MADQLALPIAALSGSDVRIAASASEALPRQAFDSEALEYRYPSVIAAKLAIADDLATPLAKLSTEERTFIDQLLAETLIRQVVLKRIREYFRQRKGGQHAG